MGSKQRRSRLKSATQLVAALAKFSADLSAAAQQSLTCRHGVCSVCNNVVSHEFMRLPNVQTVYLPCECGARVMVRYFP